MENPDDLTKLKGSDETFHKLELRFEADKITDVDWYELRTAIAENTVVREVHVRLSKEFVTQFPVTELNKIFEAIGKLPKLKYVCLGQMTGPVDTFGQIPVQSMTALLHAGAEKVLWLYMRGLVITHVYKGSDEEKEDKGDLDGTVHEESEHRSKRKASKKKKDSKKSSKKKDKKKESKKTTTVTTTSNAPVDDKSLDTKQKAAKRALEKLGDTLVGLKGLKRISLMGHFDECMHGCQLDPLFEGLGALEELEILLFAITRYDGRVLVEPSSLGSFLDNSPKIKECSVIYTNLSDDHIDEVASGIANNKTLEDLTLSGIGEASPETIGALFRAPHLKKIILKELTLEAQSVVAMAIALAHYQNLTHVEIQCGLQSEEMLALQQMILVNTGIETLHLHVTALEAVSAPLDLITATMGNPNSKLKSLKLEGQDKNESTTQTMKDIDLKEWQEIIEGIFQVETNNTVDSYILSLNRI